MLLPTCIYFRQAAPLGSTLGGNGLGPGAAGMPGATGSGAGAGSPFGGSGPGGGGGPGGFGSGGGGPGPGPRPGPLPKPPRNPVYTPDPEEFLRQQMANLGRGAQQLHDAVRTVLDGAVDGHNVAQSFAGDGLSFTTQTRTAPKQLTNSLADTSSNAYIRKKGGAGTTAALAADNKKPGIELVTKPADASGQGRVCLVNRDDLAGGQSLSFSIGTSTSAPAGTVSAPRGALNLTGLTDVVVKRTGATKATFGATSVDFTDQITVKAGKMLVGHDGTNGLWANFTGEAHYFNRDSPGSGVAHRFLGGPTDIESLRLRTDGYANFASGVDVAGDLTRDGNIVWDEANDGPGSGLDADYLDGHDSTYFQVAGSYQPLDAELTALASTTSAANKVPYYTGSGTATTADLTAAGRALIDDADAAAQRATLGLGTMAVETASQYVKNSASNTYSTGAQDLSAATSTKIGNLLRNLSNQTASSGGTYAIAATIADVYVDCSPLGLTQNFTVQLPDAAAYPGRSIGIKVVAVSAFAGSTLTISSAGGNIEGSATDVLSVATGATLKGVDIRSDGANWWIFGSKGLA